MVKLWDDSKGLVEDTITPETVVWARQHLWGRNAFLVGTALWGVVRYIHNPTTHEMKKEERIFSSLIELKQYAREREKESRQYGFEINRANKTKL